MLIAIDGNEANLKTRVGVNRFACQIIWAIYKIVQGSKFKVRGSKKKDFRFLIFLKNSPLSDLPPETDWWKYQVFGPKAFWTWIGLPKRLFFGQPRPDVLFSFSHYGPLFSPIPFMVSIMDLGFLRWPNQFTKKDFLQLKYGTNISAKKASKIVTISQFCKKDIVDTYQVDPAKIAVAYPGWEKVQPRTRTSSVQGESPKLKSLKRKSRTKGDYLLYLGTLKPSKNVEGLIKAFKLLIADTQFANLKLVIAGKKGWLYQDIFQKVADLGLGKKVIFTGFVSDSKANSLIANAKVFVMLSFWEGFGIPALEAMAAGVPVVCSDRAALPEVVANAALLANPDDTKDISDKIKKTLTDKRLRQKLVKLGKQRVKNFDWQKSAKVILDQLTKL